MGQNQAQERRENINSRELVLTQKGEEITIDNSGIQDQLLRDFLGREMGTLTSEGTMPPHIQIMQQQELVGYEPAADVGHFRFYPKGTLMKDLLEDLAEDVAIRRIGATKIDTPVIYKNEGAVKEQALSFHESDYHMSEGDKEMILRFAGDFGLFSMIKDARVSHKQLPLRVYEISPSFRREKSGSCTGLKRLRGFTMPDIHSFAKDLPEGMREFAHLHRFYDSFLKESGLPFALGFRTTEEFYAKNKDFIQSRLEESGKDALVEILADMKHYWVLKNEFQYIDSTQDNVQLSTVQLDISDADRYGLGYTTENGSKKPFTIVHSSMGSIERILGAIIEERAKEMQRGIKPNFPYWLAPTQLRLIPVREGHEAYCQRLAEDLSRKVRIDIDDRGESVGKRVRAVEKEWIPAYAVIGDKEVKTNLYGLKTRGKLLGTDEEIDILKLKNTLKTAQGNSPFRQSYLNRNVSRQLRFGSSY